MSTDPEVGARPLAPLRDDLLKVIPEHVGPRLLTPKGVVVHSTRPAGEMTFQSTGDFVAVVLAPVKGIEGRLGSDEVQAFDAPAGTVFINPANVSSWSRWSSPREYLTIGFEPGTLAELAAREFGLADLRFQLPQPGQVDKRALQIANLAKQELSEDTASELYLDSVMTIFGLHVLRRYSNAGEAGKIARAAGGLPLASARRVQEFLQEHFSGKVSVAVLATLCNLSPGHFIQAFTRTFGMPPHRYLVNLRLGFAVQLLSETGLPIAEVAYLSGFSSQSHLTSTMRKYRRITPAQVRSLK